MQYVLFSLLITPSLLQYQIFIEDTSFIEETFAFIGLAIAVETSFSGKRCPNAWYIRSDILEFSMLSFIVFGFVIR